MRARVAAGASTKNATDDKSASALRLPRMHTASDSTWSYNAQIVNIMPEEGAVPQILRQTSRRSFLPRIH
jgi:hypothetical protein